MLNNKYKHRAGYQEVLATLFLYLQCSCKIDYCDVYVQLLLYMIIVMYMYNCCYTKEIKVKT